MLQSWKEQFEENLELCRPELLASMQKKGTLEQYLDDRENQAIEMSKRFHAEGKNEGQIVELVVDSLFLREIDELKEDEEEERSIGAMAARGKKGKGQGSTKR